MAFVYVISFGRDLYKIGKTSNLITRLHNLQRSRHGQPVNVIAIMPFMHSSTANYVEVSLQWDFNALRYDHEYYLLNKSQLIHVVDTLQRYYEQYALDKIRLDSEVLQKLTG